MQEARHELYAQQYGRGRTSEFGPESIASQSEWPLSLNRENYKEYVGDVREKHQKKTTQTSANLNIKRACRNRNIKHYLPSIHTFRTKRLPFLVASYTTTLLISFTLGWLIFFAT